MTDDQARHLADLTRLGMAGNLADFVLIDKDGAVKKGSEIDYNGAPGGYAADRRKSELCVKNTTTKRCGT